METTTKGRRREVPTKRTSIRAGTTTQGVDTESLSPRIRLEVSETDDADARLQQAANDLPLHQWVEDESEDVGRESQSEEYRRSISISGEYR